MLKYLVKVNYTYFDFEDGVKALQFAEDAVTYMSKEEDRRDVEIHIINGSDAESVENK